MENLDGFNVKHSGSVRLDDPELLVAAHAAADRLVRAARRVHGPLPAVSSPAWPDAAWLVQIATLAVLGKHWLLRSPDEIAADQLKRAAVALAGGHDWTAAARRPSHAELVRRRAEPGPMARTVDDPAAAARWAATGMGTEGAS